MRSLVTDFLRLILRGVHDCLDNTVITGAAADVSRQHVAHLFPARIRRGLEEVLSRHQDTRRAEPALQRMMPAERFLKRTERFAVGQPFHGLYLAALRLQCILRAAALRASVDDDGTGTAHPVLTPHMGAVQPKLVAQEV